MSGLAIVLISAAVLLAAYIFYGGYVSRVWGINPNAKTPAHTMLDGIDYVPTDKSVVFGHQFASIAGAGPITGPIIAIVFGWLPALLWILIGGIFFGAIQDYASMYISVKNEGKTISLVIEKHVGKFVKKIFTIFIWLFCILVIAAFVDIVANTFDSLTLVESTNSANGSVASTSCLFILFAVGLGLILKHCHLPKIANTIIAIGLLVAGVAVGLSFPILGVGADTWVVLVFLYILVASVIPVWALLQPRDYLNSYLLIFMMIAAVVGILVYNPTLEAEVFVSFYVEGTGYLFPILFVTIACGAVSGFHAMVSSGTSSKQISNERDMKPVAFGAMLLESFLAVIALVVAASFVTGEAAELGLTTPSLIFSGGLAGFLETIGLPYSVTFTIISLAVSAFALTSLDSVSRVARISFQETFQTDDEKAKGSLVNKILTNKYFATVITLVIAFMLAKVGYASIWPLFGSSNQLLSALALLVCAVYFGKNGKKHIFVVIPMIIMMLISLTSLGMKIYTLTTSIVTATSTGISSDILQLAFAVALVVLAVIVAIKGTKALVESRRIGATLVEQNETKD